MTKLKLKSLVITFLAAASLVTFESFKDKNFLHPINGIEQVKITDAFWGPKFQTWHKKTLNDVFDKFEGKYDPQINPSLESQFKRSGSTLNAFQNFDLVAEGKRGIGQHDGPPWYDELVYETIRGASDFLVRYPDEIMEKRIDGYIDRIAAAQEWS